MFSGGSNFNHVVHKKRNKSFFRFFWTFIEVLVVIFSQPKPRRADHTPFIMAQPEYYGRLYPLLMSVFWKKFLQTSQEIANPALLYKKIDDFSLYCSHCEHVFWIKKYLGNRVY